MIGLPYFQFYVNEWLNGSINLEEPELKGVFVDVCAYYWDRECDVPLAMLNKRFKHYLSNVKALLDVGLIKVDENDNCKIKFLDNQYDELYSKKKRRSEAGRKGGRATQAMLKQKSSNAKALRIEENRIEENRIDIEDKSSRAAKAAQTKTFNKEFEIFWPWAQELSDKNVGFEGANTRFNACRKAGFTAKQISECYKSMTDKQDEGYKSQFTKLVTIKNVKCFVKSNAPVEFPKEFTQDHISFYEQLASRDWSHDEKVTHTLKSLEGVL